MRSALDKDKSSLIRLKDSTEYFNLSQIKMLLDTPAFFPHTSLDYVFKGKNCFWEYCRLELRSTLKNESLIELRNQLSTQTAQKIHDRELLLVRNILLGVGGSGIFNLIVESWFEDQAQQAKAA
jgi:DNA-binding transcriptional MerR regulator